MNTGPNDTGALLAADEPAAFSVINPTGTGALVLVCDHASNRVPRALNKLGLSTSVLQTHIAWDPGAAQVAMALSAMLDAPLVLSAYSRLVIDCNRPLHSPQSIPEQSAGVCIPGNRQLLTADREQRREAIFHPYQQAIAQLLQHRSGRTSLLSIHSFAPELNGEQRPWHIGVAGYRDPELARALFAALQQLTEVTVGYDQPYAIDTEFDYTVPVQGEARGLPSAMIEIRQDQITSLPASESWAETLAAAWKTSGGL